jgi:hypothetical protein
MAQGPALGDLWNKINLPLRRQPVFVSMKKTFLFRDSWHCFADSTAMPFRFYSNALLVQ